MIGSRGKRLTALFLAAFMGLSMAAVDYAEARRGGSFGSRGTRTFQSAPPTRTAPQQTAPVQRSTTPNNAQQQGTRQGQPGAQARPGFMNGFGGAMMRGLLIGGLFGMLMGYGFGGMAGMFGLLLQVLLIGGLVFLALRLFRSRSQGQPAYAGATPQSGAKNTQNANWAPRETTNGPSGTSRSFSVPSIGSGAVAAPRAPVQIRELQVVQSDLETFERRLSEVQTAFSREDHDALDKIATPEVVSYLAEEIARNANDGLRNEVTEVTLVEADIAEAWSEGSQDYATAAMRFQALDRMVNRTTGEVVSGDVEHGQTTELWTFVREQGGEWKLSAIQDANS